jgi:hypothetical protein
MPTKPKAAGITVEQPPTVTDERVFLGTEVTIQTLRRIDLNRTTLEAERLKIPYLGKWMKVIGALETIVETPTGSNVLVDCHEAGLIFLSFGKDWGDRLSILNKGTEIVGIGKLSVIQLTHIFLEKCELMAKC